MGTTCAGEPPPASATGATADLECGAGADGAGDAPQLSALGQGQAGGLAAPPRLCHVGLDRGP